MKPLTTDQKSLYANFVTGEKIEKKDFSNRVTDKELFALCGNRSGNQRARLNVAQDSDDDLSVKKVKDSKTDKIERRRLRQLRKDARASKKLEKTKRRELRLIKKEQKNIHKRVKIET